MEDNVFQDSSQTFPAPRRRNKKRLILFVAAIIILILFSVFITVSNLTNSKPEPTPTPTPTITEQIDTPTPTEEVSPTPETTNTPTSKPTSSPIDKKTGLDRSELSVTIQNGSGVAGAAGSASTLLKNLGYNVLSTGNADNFDYEDVTIRVKSASSKYLNLLKADLEAEYTVGATSTNLSSSVSADALVIIGK